MRKILFILLLLPFIAKSQAPPGYTSFPFKGKWFAGFFDTLHVPAGGTLPQNGSFNKSGRIFYDTTGTDTGFYVYHKPYWVKLGGGSSTSPGIDDVLAVGQSLTSNKTIDGGTINSLTFNNLFNYYIQTAQVVNKYSDIGFTPPDNSIFTKNASTSGFAGFNSNLNGGSPWIYRASMTASSNGSAIDSIVVNERQIRLIADSIFIKQFAPSSGSADSVYMRDWASQRLIYKALPASSITWNGISNPNADQALTFSAGNSSTWTNQNTTEDLFTINSATHTTSSLLSLNSTSTTLAAGNNLAEFVMSGANGTSSITATAIRASVTNTGTTNINEGINSTASGGTTNVGIRSTPNLIVGTPTFSSSPGIIVQSPTNNSTDGIQLYSNNLSLNSVLGYGRLLSSGDFDLSVGGGDLLLNSTRITLGSNAASTSSAFVDGSFALDYVAKTANYTATINEQTIECTANTFQVTLPTAVGITGRIYTIVNSGAGTITVATISSQTFVNVTATPTTLTMAAVGYRMVMSNGANWMLIGSL